MRLLMKILFVVAYGNLSLCTNGAKRLFAKLFNQKYSTLVRPMLNDSATMTATLGLKISQLVDMDEKNQIMVTNVWLRQQWTDSYWMWDPKEFDGIQSIYVSPTKLWTPQIVLFNNADGTYEANTNSKAIVDFRGNVVWQPPAIFQSSCMIRVEFFPFDMQECTMKFGSWTYDRLQVDLQHVLQPNNRSALNAGPVDIDYGIDLQGFHESVEWDVLAVPARRNERRHPCCAVTFPDITFNVTLRRKTLFYTINLIVPCVAISMMSSLVFLIPSDSGEKIILCISVLLTLTVFILLLAEKVPPTSLVVPLIGKYLLFTMLLVLLSIVLSIIVLNVHYRSPATHAITPRMRHIFFDVLPRWLFMPRPHMDREQGTEPSLEVMRSMTEGRKLKRRFGRQAVKRNVYATAVRNERLVDTCTEETFAKFLLDAGDKRSRMTRDIDKTLRSVQYIAWHLKGEKEGCSTEEDWKCIALVLDRLFLWLFTIACIGGTIGIFLQAPTDSREPLTADNVPNVAF